MGVTKKVPEKSLQTKKLTKTQDGYQTILADTDTSSLSKVYQSLKESYTKDCIS